MIDTNMQALRKNIIEAYEYCPKSPGNCDRDACPYYSQINCLNQLLNDVISLVKTMEPKTVKNIKIIGGHLMGTCPKCGMIITVQDHHAFCGRCGQAVKWE